MYLKGVSKRAYQTKAKTMKTLNMTQNNEDTYNTLPKHHKQMVLESAGFEIVTAKAFSSFKFCTLGILVIDEIIRMGTPRKGSCKNEVQTLLEYAN